MPLQQQLKEHYYAASLIRAVKTNIPSFASTMICVRGSSRPPFLPWRWRMKSLSFAVSALDVNLFSSHIDFLMLLSCCNCFIYIKKSWCNFHPFLILFQQSKQHTMIWFSWMWANQMAIFQRKLDACKTRTRSKLRGIHQLGSLRN